MPALTMAQSNVFPADGNVGIGTSLPENIEGWDKVLQIRGPLHSKILISSSDVTTGIWSHNIGYYGAPAGGISGTFTPHSYSLITDQKTRMTITPNGRIGIGTIAPSDLLELDGGNQRQGITLTGNGSPNAYSDLQFKVKDNSGISLDKPFLWAISHRKDGFFSDSGPNGSSLEFFAVNVEGSYLAPLSFKSNGDVVMVSDKNAKSGNVGIGTTSPKEKLSVNGNIRTREIKVETSNWPDYVFKDDYELQSLHSLEKYIKLNRHLPGMPSAAEVAEKGQNLGEINSKLLKQLEEITLHLIEKDKQLQAQEIKMSAQEDRIKKLEIAVSELLKRVK